MKGNSIENCKVKWSTDGDYLVVSVGKFISYKMKSIPSMDVLRKAQLEKQARNRVLVIMNEEDNNGTVMTASGDVFSIREVKLDLERCLGI